MVIVKDYELVLSMKKTEFAHNQLVKTSAQYDFSKFHQLSWLQACNHSIALLNDPADERILSRKDGLLCIMEQGR